MNKATIGASIVLIVAIIAVSGYGWMTIPEDAMLARHWGLSGEADGYSPQDQILIAMPIGAILLSVLFALIPKIDPRSGHVRQSNDLLVTSWLGALGLLLVVHVSIIGPAAAGDFNPPMPGATLYVVCLMIILIGNFTAKSRSNFFLGIRTPWTLSSEHAWSLANRTGGWLFVLTGLSAAAAGAIFGTIEGFKVLIIGALTAAAASILVSYFAWRSDPERKNP